MITTDPKIAKRDRHNMAKFKILWSIKSLRQQRIPANSIQIARRTRKSIRVTDDSLKHLTNYHYLLKKVATGSKNGCLFRYELAAKGKKTLKSLLPRIKNRHDLNLKHPPNPVKYSPADLEFIQREIPPEPQTAAIRRRKIALPLSNKDRDKIFLTSKGEYVIFHDPQQQAATNPQDPQACINRIETGDYFEIFMNTYVIYHSEVLPLLDYARQFYPYEGARTSQVFLNRLIKTHKIANVQSASVETIYFIKQTP